MENSFSEKQRQSFVSPGKLLLLYNWIKFKHLWTLKNALFKTVKKDNYLRFKAWILSVFNKKKDFEYVHRI